MLCRKSSIINNLRDLSTSQRGRPTRGAGPRVAPVPGYTRRISGFLVSSHPPLFLLDTPGVMLPSFGRDERGQSIALKLALTRSFKDSLIPLDTLARYLLLTLNTATACTDDGYPGEALKGLPRTDDVDALVQWVGRRIDGADDGREDEDEEGVGGRRGRAEGVKERAVRFLLRKFRTGEMGPVMLDDVDAEIARVKEEEREKAERLRLRKQRQAEAINTASTRRIRIVTLDTDDAPSSASTERPTAG